MKTSNERTQSIKQKVTAKRRSRTIIFTSAATACVLIVATVICSLPILGAHAPSINTYKKDEYYPLIQKINARYDDDKYSIFESIDANLGVGDATAIPPVADAPTDDESSANNKQPENGNKYEETTLNQVEGVIEGDILKRSTTHAFYLKTQPTLYTDKPCLALDVYRLAGDGTERVAEYRILMKDDTTLVYSDEGFEMFLSDDATRATVIASCAKEGVTYTVVVLLDISNPAEITEINRVYVSGAYLSSRKVNGKLLIIANFRLSYGYYYDKYNTIDYDKKQTYVPLCGDMTEDSLIPIKDIYVPDNCPSLSYTVLAALDESTLDVASKYAVFSYSQDVAVFADKLVVTRNSYCYYKDEVKYGNEIEYKESVKMCTEARMAELVVLNYVDGFEKVGAIGLDGYVKDRYSLDVKDNVLRVFTSVRHEPRGYYWTDTTSLRALANVSLYCIDLATMQTIASKECFAPSGDEVKSVRYEGDVAYVCTARRNTDPVFYFDLSDYSNITYVDTGEIEGFSVNLIKFNDLLLGIGQGEYSGILKVEVYKQSDDPEAENGVVGVAKYERFSSFSTKYKAHFVDAEHNLVGLEVYDWDDDIVNDKPTKTSRSKYLLLRYDEATEQFVTVYFGEFECYVDLARAFYEHNGAYVFGPNGHLFIDLQEKA